MAELLGTDEFLVNRNDVTYTQQQETLMATLQDTDHLLINRAGQTYKITGNDLINSVVDPLEVTVILAPTDGYTDTEVTAVPVVSGGKQPDGGFIFSYQWVTADDAVGTNKASIAGATNATFTPDNAQVGRYLGCVVSTTDALGTFAEGEAYIGPIQVLAQAPVIADVVVSEIYDGANRFTDKEFPYVTTMAVDGEPNPTYEVKAKLSGTTFDFDVLSDVITDVEGGGISTCETDLIESIDTETYTPASTGIANPENIYKSGENDKSLWQNAGDTNLTETTGISFSTLKLAVSDYGGNPVEVTVEGATLSATTAVDNSKTLLEYNFGATVTTQAITVNGPLTGGFYIYAVYADDVQLIDGATTLTFPSSNGFDCFAAGDVVQGPPPVIASISGYDETYNDSIGREITMNNGDEYDMTSNQTYWWTKENVGNNSFLFKKVSGQNFQVYGYTAAEADVDGGATRLLNDVTEFTLNKTLYGTDYVYIRVYATSTGVMRFAYDSDVEEVKIISKDKDATPPTITVDGGDWYVVTPDPNKDQSMVWSDGTREPSNADAAFSDYDNRGNAFDGNPTTHYKAAYSDGSLAKTQIVFNPPVQVADGDDLELTLGLWMGSNGEMSDAGAWALNGGPPRQDLFTYANNAQVPDTEVVATGPFTLNSIDLYYRNAGSSIFQVKNGSKVLVDAGGQAKLIKQTPYDTKLTVASSENLELLTSDVFMTDGSEVPATQTPYKLVTTDIESVDVGLSFDTSQTSDWIDPENAFDGDENTGTTSGQFLYFTLPSDNNTIEVVVENTTGSQIAFYIQNDSGYANGRGTWDPGTTGWSTSSNQIDIPANSGKGTITYTNTATNKSIGRLYAVSAGVKIYTLKADGKAAGTTLTFPGDVSTNPDLQYFLSGDVVSESAASQTRPVRYASTSGGFQDGTTLVRSNLSKANGGTYNGDITDLWTVTESGTLKLSMFNNDLMGAYNNDALTTFYFSSSDGVTCDQGSSWTSKRGETVEAVFTFPSAGSFSITYFVADEEFYDNHIVYYLSGSQENRYSRWNPNSGSEIVLNTGTNLQLTELELVKVISTGYPDSNTMIVDGGKWDSSNQSQVWSNYVKTTNSWDPETTGTNFSEPAVNGFDGDTSTMANGFPNGGSWIYFTPPEPFTDVTSLRIFTRDYQGISLNKTQAFVPSTPASTTDTPGNWITVTSPPSTISQIAVQGLVGPASGRFSAIEINGKILIDAINDSKVWSELPIDISGGGDTGKLLSYAFNGEQVSPFYYFQDSTFTISAFGIPASEVVIYPACGGSQSADVSFSVNGGTKVTTTIIDNNQDLSVKAVLSVPSGFLDTIEFIKENPPETGAGFWKIVVDGKELVDAGIRELGDTHVEYQTNGGEGSIIEVNTTDNTLLVTNSGDGNNRWIAENKAGTDFYVAPADAVPITQDYAWGKLQIISNRAQVTGIQKDDPGFLPVPAKDYSIKFPAVFQTGNAPDVDIPRGACVAAIVAAQNSEGRSVKESNCFMPIDVNPAGAAGPITDSTPTTLTVASNTNLSSFSPGDNMVMVNEDNEISSYTIESATIASVLTSDPTDYTFGGTVTTTFGNVQDLPKMFNTDISSTSTGRFTGSQNVSGGSPYDGYVRVALPTHHKGYFEIQTAYTGSSTEPTQGLYFKTDVGPTYRAYAGSPLFESTGMTSRGIFRWQGSPDATYIEVGSDVSGLNAGVWNISVDGNQIIYPAQSISLENDQDLKYFRPGDTVQLPTIATGAYYVVDDVHKVPQNPGQAFDGDLSTRAQSNSTGGYGTNQIDIVFNPPLTGTKIEIKLATSGYEFYLNGNSAYKCGAQESTLDNNVTWEGDSTFNITNMTGFSGTLGRLTFIMPTTQNSEQGIYAIIVDDVPQTMSYSSGDYNPCTIRYVNSTVNPPTITFNGTGKWNGADGSGEADGDTTVTHGPVTGTGTFQSADLDANTITLSVSNDRWIDTSNGQGIEFYCRDNITVLNADNPKHVAMQQAIADAFAAFPQKVNERRTSIASSFYRLMDGENLSAEEFALLEETITGAVNATEPFALDGYYPLYYTATKANAASSVGDHHVHDINGVNYYMPDGGTLYHGNYIAPETSTTDNNDSSY